MPMTATMAPYTLFILDDDTPMNPREDHDCLGKMVCWHSRYSLGEKHDYDEPSDFLRSLLFSEYSSGHDGFRVPQIRQGKGCPPGIQPLHTGVGIA